MTLNNQSGITYYRQIADILITRIYNGVYKLGEQIPPGRELSNEFGCNRHTIRRALDLIEMENLIVRQQGRGTFVVDELPIDKNKTQLTIGLIDISHTLGFRPQARLLGSTIKPAGEIAHKLQLMEDDKVTYINRLRIINDVPAIVEQIYIPVDLIPDMIKYDLNQSLRYLLKDKFHVQYDRSEVIFEPILSSSYVSELLDVPVGSAMMLEKRISYSTKNIIIEYSEHIYRGDQFSFVLK